MFISDAATALRWGKGCRMVQSSISLNAGASVPNIVEDLLSQRPWLLADGATGTNLFARGLAQGEAPELWNLERPDAVREHYRSFIDACSDIVLTNTFGGTANRLKLHGAQGRVRQINAAGARLLREEIERSGRRIVCAGSVGPTGDLFAPLGPLSHADGVTAFAEQCAGLREGGADVAWIETMSSPEELAAAAEGAAVAGLPVICTLSFDTNGRTMMGVTPTQFVGLAHGLKPAPLAFGGNCGTGAAELVAALVQMHDGLAPSDVIVAKANCGIPEFVEGEIRYSGSPELMARYAVLARRAGARIIGGCCGTTPVHVKAMHDALVAMDADASTPKTLPEITEVVESLGKVSAAAQGEGPGRGRRESSRRRREG